MATPTPEKKVVPMLLYKEDILNVEWLIKHPLHRRMSTAALTRKLYREERARLEAAA